MVGGIELQGLRRYSAPGVERKLLSGMYQDAVEITGGLISGVSLTNPTFSNPAAIYNQIVLPYADATNVKLFGAIGNGTNNDTTALQNTINAISLAGGGGVYIPPGTYQISAPLTLPGNIHLTGAGKSTIIRAADNSIDIIQIIGPFNEVRGISTQNGLAAIRLYGLATEVTNNVVEQFYSNQANYGLLLDGYNNTNYPVYWNQFRDVLVDRPKIHGVWLTKTGAGDSPNANKFHSVRVYSHGGANAISGYGFNIEYAQFNNSFIDCEANLATTALACFRLGANARTTMLINPYAETTGSVPNFRLEAGSQNTVLINALTASAGSAISDASGGNYSTYNSGFPNKNKLSQTSVSDLTIGGLKYNSQFISGNTTPTADLTVPVYVVSAAVGNVTLTLPNANSTSPNATGVLIKVIKSDNSANTITIVESGGNGPDQSSQILSNQYDFIELYCNGSAWFVTGSSNFPKRTIFYSSGGTFAPDMQRDFYLISATAGATSVTIPASNTTTAIGRQVTFKKSDASANAVTLSVVGGGTIDGAATITLANQNDTVTIISNSSTWYIVSRNPPADGSITTAKIATQAVTLSKMAAGTAGNIISYASGGAATAVATGSTGQVLTSNGAGNLPTFQSVAGGRLLNIQLFTNSGTYTPAIGTTAVTVHVIGGGGGGGRSNINLPGSGGGGGGYSFGRYTTGFSGATVTVGAGGAAAASDLTSGGNGTTSSFGALLSATGGTGGTPSNNLSIAGGAGSGGLLNYNGERGGGLTGGVTSVGISQGGGVAGPFGGRLALIIGTSTAGINGNLYGGGGTGSSGGSAAGAGAQGIIVVEEYS